MYVAQVSLATTVCYLLFLSFELMFDDLNSLKGGGGWSGSLQVLQIYF